MIDRRSLLKLGVGASVATQLGITPAFALAPGRRRVLVVNLRGGLDGLAAVAPYGDPDYYRERGSFALQPPGSGNRNHDLVDLDGFFGLHPQLRHLKSWYDDGDLIVFHAMATPYRERSHFDARKVLEGGTETAATADGWYGRALDLAAKSQGARAVTIGGLTPQLLRGEIAQGSFAPGPPALAPELEAAAASLYADDPLFSDLWQSASKTIAIAEDFDIAPDERLNGFVSKMIAAGGFLAAPAGPSVISVDMDGFDTHADQGAVSGTLSDKLRSLRAGLLRFRAMMPDDAWRTTAVLVVTEFGRAVRPNGTDGTDHGTATVALLAGGAVRGGRVVAEWPGLAPDSQHDGRDVASTLDARRLFKALLAWQFGLTEQRLSAGIFPGTTRETALPGLFA